MLARKKPAHARKGALAPAAGDEVLPSLGRQLVQQEELIFPEFRDLPDLKQMACDSEITIAGGLAQLYDYGRLHWPRSR